MARVIAHLVQQLEAWAGGCTGLDHNRCVFIGVVFVSHRLEDIIPLFDKIPDKFRAETEEGQLLDNLVNQFLELWRVESESRMGR